MSSHLKIAVISNIILEPYFPTLMAKYFGRQFSITPVPFEEYWEEEYQCKLAKADIVVVWLNLERLLPGFAYTDDGYKVNDMITLCQRIRDDLKDICQGKNLCVSFEDNDQRLSGVVGYEYNSVADRLNISLQKVLDKQVHLIDLKALIAQVGILHSYSPKGKYRWNAPYTEELLEMVTKEIRKQYDIENGITKKCLILDCDNVLWGGVLSEDGIEGIRLGAGGLGRFYQDFQRFVLSLYDHGVILAVCSKNNLSDVLKMFHEHSEMVLKEEHIACFQVNWENKPSNIQKIASILNIGLDSMVFVDDSPVEIEAVKALLPQVSTVLFHRNMSYEGFSCFNLRTRGDKAEIAKRHETYRTNQQRETLKAKFKSYEEYIQALNIQIDIHEAKLSEYGRIAELSQRTNKCTNGKRYTVTELKERMLSGMSKLYAVYVSDRFSDLGLVGAMEVEDGELVLFCLSCRALGRGVEKKMLKLLENGESKE